MKFAQNADRKAPSDDGMTLVETMIAVLILATFMAGVAGLIDQSGRVMDSGRDHYTAVTLCRNRLETARTFGFASLASLKETNFVCNANGGSDPDGLYKRMTFVNPSYGGSTNLTEITVRVYIKDRETLSFSNQYEAVQSIYTQY
jgi:prepilin-type N-terminal cleavage/methylation domain-containing protein